MNEPLHTPRNTFFRFQYKRGLLEYLAAIVVSFLIAIGVIALAVPIVFQFSYVQNRLKREVVRIVKEETGLDVSFRVGRLLWPPGIVLRDLQVESIDATQPFARLDEARVTLRPFALLSGDVLLDSIELVGLHTYVELNLEHDGSIQGGQPTNLPLRLKARSQKKAPRQEPLFRLVAVSNANAHVVLKKVGEPYASFNLNEMDLDLETTDAPSLTYNIRLHRLRGASHIKRTILSPDVPVDRFAPTVSNTNLSAPVVTSAYDDDTLCSLSLSATFTDSPNAYLFKLGHLDIDARLDDNPAIHLQPSCVPVHEASKVALHSSHLDVEVSKKQPALYRIGTGTQSANIQLETPINIVSRYVKMPALGGYLKLGLDVSAHLESTNLMAGILRAKAKGSVHVQELQFGTIRIGESIQGPFEIKPSLQIVSSELKVRYAEGDVVLTNVNIHAAPNAKAEKQFPIQTDLRFKNVRFPGLMRELAISRAAHVRWDLDEGTAKLNGFLSPLEIEGDVSARTKGFEWSERPVEQPNPGHRIGISSQEGTGYANLNTRVVIRNNYLEFDRIGVNLAHSQLSGRCRLWFRGELEVDAQSDQFDLSDISPLMTFALGGQGSFALKIRGPFTGVHGEGELAFNQFLFDTFHLGNLQQAKAKFAVEKHMFELENIQGLRGHSPYEVSNMRIDVSRGSGVTIDALTRSSRFNLDELYSLLNIEPDSFLQKIKGQVAWDGRAHFVLGEPNQDICRSGRLDLDLNAKVLSLTWMGEQFTGGNGQVSVRWFDRYAGLLGAEVDVYSMTLEKKGGGSFSASGHMYSGGHLNFDVTAGGVAISNISAIPKTNIPIDGFIDSTAHIGGSLDSIALNADVHVSPLRIGYRLLPASHLHVEQNASTLKKQMSHFPVKCYPKITAAEKTRLAFVKHTQGNKRQYLLSGSLFTPTIDLRNVTIEETSQQYSAQGQINIKNLDLSPFSKLRVHSNDDLPPEHKTAVTSRSTTRAFEGTLNADIQLEKVFLNQWKEARGTVKNLSFNIQTGDISVSTIEEKTLTIPFRDRRISLSETPLLVKIGNLETQIATSGIIDAQNDRQAPQLNARIDVPKTALSVLEKVIPRLEKADGFAQATLRLGGSLQSFSWAGDLRMEQGAFQIKGLPPITNTNALITLDRKQGIHVNKLDGEVGGGQFKVTGNAALEGFQLGESNFNIQLRNARYQALQGVFATLNADLNATWSPSEFERANNPIVINGTSEISQCLYERPVKIFNVNSIQASKRTAVQAYDPTRDTIVFDVDVQAPQGCRLRNNLLDTTLKIGASGLHVIGSNQRVGVRGDISIVPDSKFFFRRQEFDILEGSLRFEDETKLDPDIKVSAVSFYQRRAQAGSTADWRIRMDASGSMNDLKLTLTSEPALDQEDIILLLTIGMTRAEANQLGTGGIAGGAGFDLIASITGIDETLKQAIPVIDDIRFGSAYSVKTGRTEPQVTVGKRIGKDLRATLSSGFSENREVVANIEWQLSKQISLQGSYDNINDVSSSSVGNVGLDLRFRLEF